MSTDEDAIPEFVVERSKKLLCDTYTNGTNDQRRVMEWEMERIKEYIDALEKCGAASWVDPIFLGMYKEHIVRLEETINQVRQQENSTTERV